MRSIAVLDVDLGGRYSSSELNAGGVRATWRSEMNVALALPSIVAGAFALWKRFPEPRRGRMQAALQRIAAAPGLSPDVTELVTRALAD